MKQSSEQSTPQRSQVNIFPPVPVQSTNAFHDDELFSDHLRDEVT
jgi:hypothetical protein